MRLKIKYSDDTLVVAHDEREMAVTHHRHSYHHQSGIHSDSDSRSLSPNYHEAGHSCRVFEEVI